MSEGDFPFRSFTLRPEGYDRDEVEDYVSHLQEEIVELRRALNTATRSSDEAARLHDPEGAVTRTLAIAQETADRVLHDAQVEADRRRIEADEHATTTVADAEARAAKLLADIEAQAAEVREQGIAAARSAIKVERDKSMAELSQVRRARNDLRSEAVELKAALDQYRVQAREASDLLSSVASGPLITVDLPDYVDDQVTLAGVTQTDEATETLDDDAVVYEVDDIDEPAQLRSVETVDTPADTIAFAPAEIDETDTELADVIAFDADTDADGDGDTSDAGLDDAVLTDVDDEIDTGLVVVGDDGEDLGGAFLTEVRAAAEEPPAADVVIDATAEEGGDRFLSELRGATASEEEDGLVSEVADRFFDED